MDVTLNARVDIICTHKENFILAQIRMEKHEDKTHSKLFLNNGIRGYSSLDLQENISQRK